MFVKIVSGEFPVMKPGAEFSWISCTSFNTPYGNMRGYFTMKNLLTGLTSRREQSLMLVNFLKYKTA